MLYDNNVSNLIRRSDSWPFIQKGVPAIWFHTGLHPDYHTVFDRPEVLYLAADNGLRVTTVPVRMSERAGGKPSAGPLRSVGYALRMMWIVASHTFAHRQRTNGDRR